MGNLGECNCFCNPLHTHSTNPPSILHVDILTLCDAQEALLLFIDVAALFLDGLRTFLKFQVDFLLLLACI